jgi:hypothetical protein
MNQISEYDGSNASTLQPSLSSASKYGSRIIETNIVSITDEEEQKIEENLKIWSERKLQHHNSSSFIDIN